MQTRRQSKPQKFLSELAAVDLSNTSGGSLENSSQAFKSSAFLSDPGFVDDQRTAKNTCLTATETQEVVKTVPNEYFMVHFTGGWVISETLLTRCYLIGFHLIGGLLGQKHVHFLPKNYASHSSCCLSILQQKNKTDLERRSAGASS